MHRIAILCKLFLLTAVAIPAAAAAKLQPVNLRCDYRTAPLGVQSGEPRLAWVLQAPGSSERGLRQSAYRILVASKRERLQPGKADLWDSGEVISDKMAQIAYAGQRLQSAQQYWWTVRVSDQNNRKSDWAEPATWTMGLLSEKDWEARWIGACKINKSGPMPLFHREFVLGKPLRRALVFVCGLGSYEMHINGQRVGDSENDPGWTDYRKSCLYSTYDVTELIQRGTNALGLMLGNGMYNVHGGRYSKFVGSFGLPKFILQLHLEFADGTATEVVSDGQWKTASGPITFSCVYGGEDYDAGLEKPGWDTSGLTDETWTLATEVDGPGGKLVAQSAPPIKVMRVMHTAKITQPSPGVFVYDLGQNFSGRPRITVEGRAGAEVKLIPGELLHADGLVDQGASGTPVFFSYRLKGLGRETWHPRFSYYGFRYVQVQGAVPPDLAGPVIDKPVMVDLAGEFTHSSASPVGHFECSNTLINHIHALILAAIDSNLQSVLTDCPHREKLGWLETSHLLGRAIMFNYDVPTLWRKICRDTGEAQLDSGLVPDIAPEYTVFKDGYRDSPEWGSACAINPWLLFQVYGDRLILEQQYDVMRRYVEYLGNQATNHIISYGLGDWCDVGPNSPGESQLTSKGITATAIYYEDIQILRQAAALLGKEAEAQQWESLAQQIRQAFNSQFFSATLATYDRGSQTASAMPLVLGLAELAKRGAVLKALVDNVVSGKNEVTSGDIGFRYLVEALRAGGRSDVVFDLVTQTNGPGYAMQLAKGATTLTETWDASMYSRNHCMLGHAEEWFYTGLAGINLDPSGPGFRRMIIAPQPVGDLTWAKASYDSISGRIESSWTIAQQQFKLEVTIPPNTTATVWIPAKDASSVKEGNRLAAESKGVTFLRSENGASAFAVGSGHYTFATPWYSQ